MLDNNQLEAVNFYKGPCLTLAGPGSGKTTVLVNRIKHLIEDRGVSPDKILVITFTKDAALEMKSRFISASHSASCSLVNFGTFHSVFFQILRREINITADAILQGKSLISVLKEVAKACDLKVDDTVIEGIYKEFSYINNTGTDISEYESESFDTDGFRRLYVQYNDMKKELNKIDFDDMLSVTFRLFRDNPSVLSRWQKRFSFYLIDEMQDMNDLQFGIVKMLAKSRNIFAVGDDDQSIYGFRGANPDIMLEFPKVYEDCTVIRLSKNYRSVSNIVSSSANLISNNKMRYDKLLVAYNTQGGSIDIRDFNDNEIEASWVCEQIVKELEKSSKGTIAVLFRNKNQSLSLMRCMTDKGVPYFVKEKIANIYNHWIFRDIMSIIKISLGMGVRADFLRIYNKPNRYISRACIDRENVTFADMKAYYNDKSYMVDRINTMERDINRISTMKPGSAIYYIRKVIGYDDYIKEASHGSKKHYDDCIKILNNIVALSRGFSDVRSFLEECNNRIEFEGDKSDESHSRVFLYTFHASKGLEFDKVFILDVNEGVTPSKKAESDKALEEERRMFYVALTRAKKSLTLCHIRRRNNEKLFPSRFIDEMRQGICEEK